MFFHVYSLVNLNDNIQKKRKTPQKHVVLSLQMSTCLFVEKGQKTGNPEQQVLKIKYTEKY